MILEKERKQVIEYSLKLLSEGLTNGTAGNVSIFNREKGLVAISPTGVNYSELTPEMISIVDLDKKLIEGLKPSSELEMHMILYRNREDVNAVIHTHPVYTTVLACLRQDLPAIDYMIAVTGATKVKCAEYASYGTKELAENAYKAMGNSLAVILANHGLTTAGKDIANAFNITVQVEYISNLYIKARNIGEPIILPDNEMNSMLERFKTYGQIKSIK
ncbi:L-fuculose-phosphate aldolase [Leptotrichia sp. oral taxon 879]|uniref:L-fuculose-phosphate aldolase n=1 Tax=Leptotrichia sp. oral taxon 879 TaxID=1227267 RepID=UPI0003ADAA6D|nr:L-fuculose-phosphate aldolase [Leptotrichia sp. oral taxon 879]ERK55228.1 putative L-ribulose-5-phosphate 4-epimerase [Leptotrichia sp. oral taxon 879 str. F0557]